MMRIEVWLQSAAAATLGRTLLHSLWEGAAIALGLAIVLWVVRSPRLRYAAACGAMVTLLAAMIVTFARLFPQEPAHLHLTGIGNSAGLPPWNGSLSPFSPNEWKPTDELAWLAPFWIVGVLIFHLRGLASWTAARRLRNRGVCRASDLWQNRVDRLASRFRLARPVVLLESCFAEVPVVIGYLKPVILMPVGLMAGLPTGQVEAILLHELAHIRRFDYLVNLLQVFVEGLLFYHPAVWWISGVIRAERENCCDDLVVAATGSAIEYATALASLEQRRENAGMALAATGGGLVNRIQRLLGRKQRGYAGAMPVFTAAILTVTVVAALGALQIGPASIATVSAVTKTTPVLVKPTDAKRVPLKAAAKSVTVVLAQAEKPVPAPAPNQAQNQPPNQPSNQAPNQSGDEFKRMEQFFRLQQPAAPAFAQNTVPNPLTPEQQKAKDALRRELATPYKKWLDQDVVYIISDEERKAFQQLDTDAKRAQFVEEFWERRDPTPGTSENEFKSEIYRRIAYADDHFSAGDFPGWRTDRGRIYIQYGPPDEVDAHSSGGTYERPLTQGGGTTQTYPFEQWRYRYIDGVGQNIIIEFVDTGGKGEYRMTMDPAEKDALLNRK